MEDMFIKILTVLLELLLGTSTWWRIIFRLLYIFGLYGVFRKCGVKPWKAFIPFVREYEIAVCADHEMEGRTIAVLSVLSTIISLITDGIGYDFPTAVTLLLGSLAVAIIIVSIIYDIRIMLGLCEVFQRRKRWLWVWILLDPVAAVLWGWNDKFQPSMKIEDLREDALKIVKGTTGHTEMGEGLSVNLTERTVTEFFHKRYLLRDISMNIKPGHMVLLLGGSGAGKTTFLNAVNGYEKAKAKVLLNGKDVYSDYKKMQYQIGFVPQQNLMRGKDTISHTVDDAALLRLPTNVNPQDRKTREGEVLDIFGLGASKDNHVEKLSGGQLRRLSIAMEFISNPSLFILDEPDSGLDGVMARELMTQLRKIADQGKIVIVITHTPDRVIDLFDDVIVLAKDSHRTGRLAFFGSIDEARSFFGRDSMEKIVMSINSKDAGGEGRADEFIRKYAEVCNG